MGLGPERQTIERARRHNQRRLSLSGNDDRHMGPRSKGKIGEVPGMPPGEVKKIVVVGDDQHLEPIFRHEFPHAGEPALVFLPLHGGGIHGHLPSGLPLDSPGR